VREWVLTPDDPPFPKSLLALEEPPKVLYARGDLSVLDQPIAAIVGSRQPTNYGIKIAYEAAREAARAGIVVVSGLARGLDGRAHRGALDAGGRTVAVLGSGFDVAYPRQNLDLLETIPAHGLLLSELPPGTRPTQWSFPARNRLIAALAKCLLVVEGQQAGGTNNTAWWMLRLDKPVLAVPGRIDEPVAAGPNRLIWDMATPYLSPADLLGQFGLAWDCGAAQLEAYPGAVPGEPGGARSRGGGVGAKPGACEPVRSAGPRRAPCVPSDRRRAAGANGEQASSRPALDADALEAFGEFAAAEATVFDLVTPDPVHVDRIAERAGLAHGTLLAALSSLEIKGLVTQLPGKQFRLAS